MCGIAGILQLNNEKIEIDYLKKYTDTLFHRGPDGAGYKLLHKDTIGLGHRRLSILDLSEKGKQPMSFNDRYFITYNGEVFNFIEIREELEIKGYTFRTETDTEIILMAYHCWGKEAFNKFNGMWAFAIWDDLEKKLLLCRDRYGVKPLHYVYVSGSVFAFASETIAFGCLKNFKKEPNEPTLLASILNPSTLEPTGKTIYKNIHQLLPGHYMEINLAGQLTKTRWWNTFDNLIEVSENEKEKTEHFFELFKSACKLRLRSDVSVASALSGGVDSSSVFAMVHHLAKTDSSFNRLPNDWKKAVVATFPGTEHDERRFADVVINYLNSEVIYTQPDYINLPKDIISTTKLFDSISGTPIISVVDVYKAMKQNGITVSLDGHGGDELLYGYKATINSLYWHYCEYQSFDLAEKMANTYSYMGSEDAAEQTKKKLLKTIGELKSRNFISKLKDKILKQNKEVSVLNEGKNFNLGEWFSNDSVESLIPYELFQGINSKFIYVESLAVKDFFIDHIPYNLRDFDRAAMQNGVEIRMPLLDYRLVNYCFSLPLKDKVGSGYTKLILRNAMKGLLPEEIRLRKNKIGLGAPIANWFNTILSEFICDEVSSKDFLETKLWKGEVIKDFVHTTTKQQKWDTNSALKFWNILNTQILINKRDN